MLEACTVPEEVLKKASTEQLLDMILDNPLLCDIYAYDTVEKGIAVFASRFNGFKELLSREDFEEVVMEDILAQEDVVESLSDEDVDKLIESVEDKTEEKIESDLYYGNETPFYDVISNNGVIDEIDIKEVPEIVSETVGASATTTTVKTPKGTKVTVVKNSYKGDTWASAVTDQYSRAYPLAYVLAKADNRYNCHSYAWYSASTSNRYWMDNQKPYVNDGSYTYVGTSPTASGQKAVYKYQKVPYDSEISSDVGLICKYEMNADGTWSAGGNNYKYKLQLTGRLPNSSADITYVVLSNNTLLSFETVSKSFLSSSSTDWLDAKKACVVQIITE